MYWTKAKIAAVVKTEPEAGVMDVDSGTKEIRVTFSKEMRDGDWSWVQISDQTFPKLDGKVHYLADRKTCVLPVKLAANQTYVIWVNEGRFNAFQDMDGHRGVPYLLVFQTGAKSYLGGVGSYSRTLSPQVL